jgi:hypothetical protein
MLSPDQVASQGPGGFLNLNGGPTDPYYALSDGTSYPSLAAACAAVPTAARRNRTVSVAGTEYQWVSDLSDAGLLPKAAGTPGTGGGIGAVVTLALTTAGAQVQLPAGLRGISKLFYRIQPRVGAPPSSYSDTLSASNPGIEGINAVFASTQTAATNVIPGVTGATLTLQVLDSSDGGSTTSFDYLSGYAGTYLNFGKKDGSFIALLWPSADSTVSI